jgi:hypothetical protein
VREEPPPNNNPLGLEVPNNPVEKILGLKKLLGAGALTQEEFDQKKGELLGQI